MAILIFVTDLRTKKRVKSIESVFDNHTHILNWSVDLEDVDKVLRIEATEKLTENEVIHLGQKNGISLYAMAD